MPKEISNLETLPVEAQEKIIGWLEIQSAKKVVERIALPPPDGFGLPTHVTTLRRFYARHTAAHRQPDLDLARDFAPGDSAAPVADATQTLVTDWAFQIATKPRRDVAGFKALSRWILKQREQEQRDQELKILFERLALDREKFEFNAARQALLHHASLGDILKNTQTTDEEKINAARDALFGKPATPSRLPECLPPQI